MRSVLRCLPFCTRCTPERRHRDQARVQQYEHKALVGAGPKWGERARGLHGLDSRLWREDMEAV